MRLCTFGWNLTVCWLQARVHASMLYVSQKATAGAGTPPGSGSRLPAGRPELIWSPRRRPPPHLSNTSEVDPTIPPSNCTFCLRPQAPTPPLCIPTQFCAHYTHCHLSLAILQVCKPRHQSLPFKPTPTPTPAAIYRRKSSTMTITSNTSESN